MSKIKNGLRDAMHRIGKVTILKRIGLPVYLFLFENRRKKKRNRVYLENGLQALQRFNECFEKNNLEYCLAFGTMLGAVREHGFIKHDLDIDTSMWYDDYTEKLSIYLAEYGFKLLHTCVVDDGKLGRHETYQYKGVNIDIFFFYPPVDRYPYCLDFLNRPDCATYTKSMQKYGGLLPRRIELPITRERQKVQFESIELYIPSNAKQILEYRYGPDYMIPNPNCVYNNHIVEWPEKLGVYKEY